MLTSLSTAAVVLAGLQLATAQTFTSCNPTEKTCPSDAALGTTLTVDFTAGASSDFSEADGTNLTYTSDGAQFIIAEAGNAPTITSEKYIFFGNVEVYMKASTGDGVVSSFILESDDLDEIDWEWIGSVDESVESNFFGKGNTTTYDRALYHTTTTSMFTEYHTYGVDWTSERIQWSIDGSVVRTLAYGDALALGGRNYPQTPMQVKMGNWIGCTDINNPATQGTCEWMGNLAYNSANGPYTMSVKTVTIKDYVGGTTVPSTSCAGGTYTYGDLTGSFSSIQSSCDGTTSGGSSSSSSSSSSSGSGSSTAASGSSSSTSSISVSSTRSGVASGSAVTAIGNTPTGTSAGVFPGSGSVTGTGTGSSSTPTSTSTSAGESSAASSGSSDGSSTAASAGTASATTSKPATTTSNAGSSTYGVLDYTVIALGLGLGYLVM
ncbi:hypothetical protein B7494_g8471 [Chlorociboria aeruginascens]|nr:hypothetical protein B7494_g8471 [Chlorociboria aeruginascens]